MKKGQLLPKEEKILEQLGENIKLARRRRKISAKLLAERANISRTTLWNLAKGEANVSLYSLIQVLNSLGLEKDLLNLAKDDELGRKLQDIELLNSRDRLNMI